MQKPLVIPIPHKHSWSEPEIVLEVDASHALARYARVNDFGFVSTDTPLLYFFALYGFFGPCPSRQVPKLSLRPVDAVPAKFDSQGVVAWSVAGYPAAEHWRATLQLQL